MEGLEATWTGTRASLPQPPMVLCSVSACQKGSLESGHPWVVVEICDPLFGDLGPTIRPLGRRG